MLPADLKIHVRSLVEPTIARLGYELVAVEWLGDQRGPLLRVSIDGPEGVSAEACGLIAEHISPLLDEDDPIASAYTLEISSPGIDRPVQRPEDFERFVGFRIKIRLVEGHPRRRYTGTLSAYDDGEITVNVDNQEHRIAVDTIDRANLVLDLEEYQKLAERKQP